MKKFFKFIAIAFGVIIGIGIVSSMGSEEETTGTGTESKVEEKAENTEKKEEAKVYKAIDGLEAVIQHNFSDLSTWIPREYELNKTYADDKVAFSDYSFHFLGVGIVHKKGMLNRGNSCALLFCRSASYNFAM